MPYISEKYQSPTWNNGQPPAINESELNAVNTATFSAQKSIGEMLLTLRTVTDTDYILCDGSSYDTEAYPQLAEYLPLASSSAYSYPSENILGMKVATSLNGNYMARATCEGSDNVIQLYDKDNDTWVTFNHDWGSGDTYNSYWQDMVINDNGLLALVSYTYNPSGTYSDPKTFTTIDCSDIYNPVITYNETIPNGVYKANELSHLAINNSGVIVRYEEKDSTVYKFAPTLHYGWIEVTYPLPYYASADRFIKLRLLENGACFLAFIYKNWDDTLSLMMYYRGTLEHTSWQSISSPTSEQSEVYTASADINNNGTVICVTETSGTFKHSEIYKCEAYGLSQWEKILEISAGWTTPTEGTKVFLNDNGLITFMTSGIWLIYPWYCNINTLNYSQITTPYSNAFMREVGVVINNQNDAIGYSSIANELIYTQNANGSIQNALATSEEHYVATGGTNTIASQTGIYKNIGGDGKVPNASDMGFGTFTLADLGNLYIRANDSDTTYIAWANNSTKLTKANLDRFCGEVEENQLLIGDYILTTKTNIDFRANDFLLCDGRAVTEAQYPILYPLVVAKFGNANLPNFEANGISGIHLYVKAK